VEADLDELGWITGIEHWTDGGLESSRRDDRDRDRDRSRSRDRRRDDDREKRVS
jgi:hypothetical protein